MIDLAIATGAYKYIAGQETAKTTAELQNKSLENTYGAYGDKQTQVNQSASLEESARLKQGMAERSKLAAIAGESGALGLSSDRLLANSFMQEGSDIATMEKNRTNEVSSISGKMTQAQNETDSKITTVYNSAPSLIGTGLQIGSDSYKGTVTAKTNAKTKASV